MTTRVDFNYSWNGNEPLYQKRLSYLKPHDIMVVTGAYNGPGTPEQYDPDLHRHIQQIKDKGAVPFGYIYAGYGKRDLLEFLADLTTWSLVYGVDRVFIDEWNEEWGSRMVGAVWGMCRGYASQKEPVVIVNPGKQIKMSVNPPLSALIVTYEGTMVPDRSPSRTNEVAIVHHSVDAPSDHFRLIDKGWKYSFVTQGGYDVDPGI